MSVTLQLSAEDEAFMKAEIAQGVAADEADFLAKAVELYREFKVRHEDLQGRVQESLAQYERGEVRSLDTAATQTEARRRLSQDR